MSSPDGRHPTFQIAQHDFLAAIWPSSHLLSGDPPLIIGVLQFELIIHDSQSLKDKRRVVRSVKDRLHNEHQVSVAEVAAQDTLNQALLGLACVGTDGKRVGEVLDRITEKLRATPGAELGSVRRHILTGEAPDEQTLADVVPDEDTLADEMLRRASEVSL